jgi:hypothetical protein
MSFAPPEAHQQFQVSRVLLWVVVAVMDGTDDGDLLEGDWMGQRRLLWEEYQGQEGTRKAQAGDIGVEQWKKGQKLIIGALLPIFVHDHTTIPLSHHSLPYTFPLQHILRLLNTNVKGTGKIMFALTEVKGVGRRYANLVCKKADVDMNKR